MSTRTTLACARRILACSLIQLAAVEATAGDFVKPRVAVIRTAPLCLTVSWAPEHENLSFSGLHEFVLVRDTGQQPQSVGQQPYYSDCNLQPNTAYRYRVCATYETEDPDNYACSEWTGPVLTSTIQPDNKPPPPPSPRIVSHDAGDRWIGVRWEAGHTYDSYFVNTSENTSAGLQRNTRTIHHDDDGNWGYQRVEGLNPGQKYYFEVQGCTESLLGILEDNCWGWSQVYEASTLPPPDPNICVNGFVWREAVPGDLVCVVPEERDVNIPNDDAEHAARSRRRFDPNSCPLTNPKSRKCFVTECIAPSVWRATPGDRTCISPERARQVEADNAAAPSRRIG